MSNKPELEQDKSNIFGTIGSVIGSIVGGPGGAVVGNLLGQTAGGREFNSLQDVFQTGLGTFFNAQMGPAGLAFNAMGGGGGGGENNQQASRPDACGLERCQPSDASVGYGVSSSKPARRRLQQCSWSSFCGHNEPKNVGQQNQHF